MRTALSFFLTVWLLPLTPALAQMGDRPIPQQKKALQKEIADEYYARWAKQTVGYIITEEERQVFENLTTSAEKDQFIEQFWLRRDPEIRTSVNEYREEHFRRVAYANAKFGSGIPGWKTDRGRLYITFGPPDIIEDHPSGGWYYRPKHEGGGATSTYPFQIWIYNYIEGVGDQVEVEFVDPSWSGEYHMALEPWEKDALLHVGFSGPTDLELEGRLSKLDRPYFSPGHARNTKMQNMLGMRMKDKPFEKMIQAYKLQQPAPIKYKDLKALVTTRVTYTQLPFKLAYNHLAVSPAQSLVPVTLELQNRDVTFKNVAESGTYRAQVNIYGVVQTLTGRIIKELEDTLVLEFPAAELDVRRSRRATYQQMLLLAPGRYKLTLVLKDDNSGNTGTLETGLVVPAVGEEKLDASSVILARSLQPITQDADLSSPFSLGDLKVVPNVTGAFHEKDDMGFYLQVYNAAQDSASGEPAVEVEYQIRKDGKVVRSYLDPKRNSVLNYGNRLVLVQAFNLEGLEKGRYTLTVRVRDEIRKKEIRRDAPFTVVVG